MARSYTSTQAAALNALHRSTHKYVLIEDADGNMVDVTDLEGYNWLVAAEIDATVDQPISGARITLWRNKEGLSLAPLIEGSAINRDAGAQYAPFVNAARKVEVWVAPMIAGAVPGPGDKMLLWEGYIDDPDWGGTRSRLTFHARDPVARLNDTFIEELREYGGGSPPTPVEDVMQQILDDNFGSGAFPLTVVGDPDYGITGEFGDGYELGNVTVLEALTKLRDEIGWNLHWRWDESAGEFRLTFYEPSRDRPQESGFTADWTFGTSDYYDVTEIGFNQAGIRNAGKLLYIDADGVEQFVEDERPVSITIYERRFILVDERGSSIQTAGQAARMLGAILDDLESPPALQTIESAFHWPLDLADVHTYEANERWYDTDQDWAVYAYRHVLTPTTARTYITAGGKPSGGFSRWHRAERRERIAPESSPDGIEWVGYHRHTENPTLGYSGPPTSETGTVRGKADPNLVSRVDIWSSATEFDGPPAGDPVRTVEVFSSGDFGFRSSEFGAFVAVRPRRKVAVAAAAAPSGDWSLIHTAAPAATTYQDAAVIAGTDYEYFAAHVDGAEGSPSNVVDVTTLGSAPEPAAVFEVGRWRLNLDADGRRLSHDHEVLVRAHVNDATKLQFGFYAIVERLVSFDVVYAWRDDTTGGLTDGYGRVVTTALVGPGTPTIPELDPWWFNQQFDASVADFHLFLRARPWDPPVRLRWQP